MADAAPVIDPNNPAGDPPVDISNEIMDTLGLSDTSSAAAAIAAKAADKNAPPAPAVGEPGGGSGAAPTPPPEPAPAATPPPAAPEPAPAPASGEPPASPAPTTPPVAPPAIDEAALREASLTAQLDAARREVESLRANPQPAQPAAATGTGQPAGEDQPIIYGLHLPEKTQQMLMSDNPQDNIAAIQQLVNDLGTIVHNSVVKQLRSELDTRIAALPIDRGVDPAVAAREAAKKQYYDAFPAHNKPDLEPIVSAQAAKLAAEFPGLPWNEHYINALGARVNATLTALGAAPAPAESTPPAVPAVTPPKAPAPFIPTGIGGGVQPAVGDDLSTEIMETLDPFA